MRTKRTKWIVCPVCEGEGKTVNPSIDCNGLTAEDFAEDPDFAEEYWRGTYDVTCRACDGKRVVTAQLPSRWPAHSQRTIAICARISTL